MAGQTPETVAERAALVLAGRTRYSRHGQLCLVWTRRPKDVRVGLMPARTPTDAELGRCDCWVLADARRAAAELAAAGLLVEEGRDG